MTYEIQKIDAAKMAEEAQQLSADIQPLLKGRGPDVQSAVLADLVSLWLAGNWPQGAREVLLQQFIKLVRDLVPVSEAQIFGDGGHPGRGDWVECGDLRPVVLESPYAGRGWWPASIWYRRANVRYARACVRDSLLRGEAPIASHLLYTQPGILRDRVPEERKRGILAGLEWGKYADVTVVYTDFGISKGMEQGITAAKRAGRPIEYRRLSP